MRKRITLHDKCFQLSLAHTDIAKAVDQIAQQMKSDFGEEQNILFLSVLNGAFMFTADLMKAVDFDCEIIFIKVRSYEGTESSGGVQEVFGLDDKMIKSIEGRTIVLIEDIVDTGTTIEYLYNKFKAMKPKQIKIATILHKPGAYKKDIHLDYVGINLDQNDFIVGYGLDYDGLGRNYKDVYTLVDC